MNHISLNSHLNEQNMRENAGLKTGSLTHGGLAAAGSQPRFLSPPSQALCRPRGRRGLAHTLLADSVVRALCNPLLWEPGLALVAVLAGNVNSFGTSVLSLLPGDCPHPSMAQGAHRPVISGPAGT